MFGFGPCVTETSPNLYPGIQYFVDVANTGLYYPPYGGACPYGGSYYAANSSCQVTNFGAGVLSSAVTYTVGETPPVAGFYYPQPTAGSCPYGGTVDTIYNVPICAVASYSYNNLASTHYFVYAANNGGNSISMYVMDPTSGALTANGTIATGLSPFSIAVDPTGRFVYTSNFAGSCSSPGSISMYAINQSTGQLISLGPDIPAGIEPTSIFVDPTGRFVYTANDGGACGPADDTLSMYTINQSTGVLTHLTAMPARYGGLNVPFAVTVDPSGLYVYAANGNGSSGGSVSEFTINQATGNLTAMGGSPVLTGVSPFPLEITADPTGRFVYATNEDPPTSNDFSMLSINPTNGSLTAMATFPSTGTQPNGFAIDPFGRLAFTPNAGSSNATSYGINPTTGLLTAIGTSGAGSVPFGFAIDPTGRFGFAANEGSNSISAYTINRNTGALGPATPYGAGTGSLSVAVTAGPGRFAYVANLGANTVSYYFIDPNTGWLTQFGSDVTVGTDPSSVVADPSGRFVYVANGADSTVSMFSVTPKSGVLTSIASAIPTGSGPNTVAVDPTGRFAYTANAGSSNISVYTINQTTGALTSQGTTSTTSAPTSVAFDTTGNYLYATEGSGNLVANFSINQTNGTLTSVGTTSTTYNQQAIAVNPVGRYAYSADGSSAAVTEFSVSTSTGVLTPIGTVSTGVGTSQANSIAVHPTGRYAYVANAGTGNVTIYTISSATGLLTQTGLASVGSVPSSVSIDPTGRFLYVVNKGTSGLGTVTIFQINPISGGLSGGTTVGTGDLPVSIFTVR